MKLELGKRYVMRNGEVTEGLLHNVNSKSYPFWCQFVDCSWTTEGVEWLGVKGPFDIVAEYKEPEANSEECNKVNKPHKHAEVIKAWADGAEIEYRDPSGGDPWELIPDPHWIPEFEYRVKPKLSTCTRTTYSSLDVPRPDLEITVTKDPSTGVILDLQWKQLLPQPEDQQ